MKYCTECGEKIFASSDICPYCGGRQPVDGVSTAGVLNYRVPEIAFAYRRMATFAAYALPEEVPLPLLHIWIADTRGESFAIGQTLDELDEGLRAFRIWFKEAVESAAREGHIEIADSDDCHIQTIAALLSRDRHVNHRQAIERWCQQLRSGNPVATLDEIKSAKSWLRHEVCQWLTRNGIKYYDVQLTIIPNTALQRALGQFKGNPDVLFSPDIPQDKLANALVECGVPNKETIAVLIDCTIWGSAKDAVLFGSRGVYYHNSGGFAGFLPYVEFPNRTFNYTEVESQVSLGCGERLSLSGSQVNTAQLVSMLELIRKEVVAKQKRPENPEGLSGIPGMTALKRLLLEDVVHVLRNPEEYRKYRISIPNGILFYGPPGCGKTFVAQRLAGELNYNFTEVSPGTIASSYVHGTVSKVRSIFEQAARGAPALLFVDEFEGMVPSRRQLGSEDQYKSEEVNEWLVQIGSCVERKILFIAATNEPWKIDEAIMRTGRLDKKVYIGPPDCEAIGEMLRFHLEGRPVTSTDVSQIFADQIQGQGYSASDLKALADEAAKMALKERSPISVNHLERAAVERVPPSISKEQEDVYLTFR